MRLVGSGADVGFGGFCVYAGVIFLPVFFFSSIRTFSFFFFVEWGF